MVKKESIYAAANIPVSLNKYGKVSECIAAANIPVSLNKYGKVSECICCC